jgi:AbrB family looped-hinge helix DNA binding protein
MSDTISMDAAGRIVVPKRTRERYGLRGGQRLELIELPDAIMLRPAAEEARADRDTSGWVVFHATDEVEIVGGNAIDEERRRRHESITSSGE